MNAGAAAPPMRKYDMNIKDWLARLVKDLAGESGAGTAADPVPAELHEKAISGLNFGTAIEAHQEWKSRLLALIESRCREELDPNVVCRDDQCELGKWLHGVGGRQFGGEPQFADLRNRHAYFHVCAGRVLSLVQSGQKELATAEMSPGGEFARTSWEVIGDLASMFLRLQAVEPEVLPGSDRS